MDKRRRPRRWPAGLVFLAVLAAGLFWAVPALADYLGPDRTVVTWVWRRLECEYQAIYDPPEPGYYSCMLYRYYTPDASCPATSEVAGYFTPSACSWPDDFCRLYGCSISRSSDIVSCTDGQQGCRAVERRVTHPEATVSGTLGCGTAGSGGWCRGGGELGLSANEPLPGYEILLIEGTRNGEVFACPGASCSIPLAEGWNEFSYWALSSWGDSSRMGTTSAGLDSQAPVLAGEASGAMGAGGWYVTEVVVSASASDPAPGSGLAALEVRLDGGGWGSYGGPLVLYDGVHSVELRASDVAGNTSSLSQAISVDTGAPMVALSAADAFCPRCGESLEIIVSAQDGVSGLEAWRLSAGSVQIAGGSGPVDQVVSWDGAGISGGVHTLTMWAADAAGHESEASQVLTVRVPPAPASEPTRAAPLLLLPASPTATVTRTPAPTRTPSTFTFGGLPAAPPPEPGGPLLDTPPDDPDAAPAVGTGGGSGVLWGGAALALIGLVTAFVLEQAQRRKEEEAAERAEMLKANAEAEVRDQEYLAWQAAVAWAAKQEAERLAQEQADEQARAAAVATAAMDQMWGEENKSLKAFVQAKLAAARRLALAVANEVRLKGVVDAREGGLTAPTQTAADASIPRATGTPTPSSTPPLAVPTAPAILPPTSTPRPPVANRRVSDTYPPHGYTDPREIPQLMRALRSGGTYRVRNSPGWVGALTGGIEWGEVFSAEARTSMAPAVSTGATMSGGTGRAPQVSQPWSLPVGPVTLTVSGSPQPSLTISYRGDGVLTRYTNGGAGIDFSSSVRITSEGRLFNQAWTVEYSPLDYRVTGPEETPGLPGYAGRAGVYVKLYPARTMLLASVYVAVGLVAWELLAPLGVLLPQLGRVLAY